MLRPAARTAVMVVEDNTSKGDLGETEPYVVGTAFSMIADIEQGPGGDLYVASLGNGHIHHLPSAQP